MCETFATSVASNLVSKLLEPLFAPIGRQFGYVLCYKGYVEDLKNEVEDLENAWERVQCNVQEAKINGKPIHMDVENWLKSVKEETEKADNLLKFDKSSKNACFRGWLPNPVVRHPIGRKVNKMTKVIQGLHKESLENIFQNVYYENPPIGIVTATTSAARSVDNKDVLESRAIIMEEVLKTIVDDKVCVIGVWGPGGVGKSKLLKDVEKRVKEENLFDVVATANVSCNPDLKRIQEEIIDALGLHLMNEKSFNGRARRLCEILENYYTKNILIILDDLWKNLELKAIGIPCGDDNKVRGCKLLLTSRNRDVLRTHMGSDREFQLNLLDHGEARKLFERTVGDRVNNPEFEPWVDGVVKNCGGLPLLVFSLGKSLRGKDVVAWRDASTNKDRSDVKSLVERSYNDLKDERIKSLFLICALNSGRISMRDSLVYSMGLGLFRQISKTIHIARDRLMNDLHSLQDSSLLLESDDMESFEMHDIFVDVAISMHAEFVDMRWNTLVGKKDYGFKEWSEDELRKCTAMSFSYVDLDKLPEKLDCPNLRMLLLFKNDTSLEIPKSFFESMEKLQVLHFAGLSFTSLTSSMQVLGHLKSLCLDDCYLEDVTVLGKLKGLQFLSFARSSITRLPKEIGELTELRFLDLTGCFKLKIIENGMLQSLVNLEELHIDSFRRWEAKDRTPQSNASLAELNNMEKLRTLYIAIPHSTSLPSDLPFANLNEHKIKIGGIQYWRHEYTESRTLELELDSSNLFDEVWMQNCLRRTEDLRLDGLQDGRDSIHDLCTEGFKELKHLYVKNNLSFRYVVGSTQCPTFTRLESLVLMYMNNLEKICHYCLAPESFNKLKIVKVENCNEIKQLFPSSMKRIFSQLEEIELTRCHLMQQIVADAEVDEYRYEIDDDADVKSCKLRRLTLQNLPNMMSFYKTGDCSEVFLDGQQVSLPWLETLTLSKLPKLKEIWNSQFPSDVSSLKFLKVEDCAFLLSMIPSNFLIKLQNLEAITVKRCQLIREVFDLERLTTSGDVEILSQLTRLTFSELPSLEHIWNKNPRRALCFRNLTTLKVQNCVRLRFLFSSSMANALGQIKEIDIASCELMEEVVDVQEEESEETATTKTLEFPLLTSLSLKELPNIKTFSYAKYCIHFPSLTRLTISGCPKMMAFSSFEGKQQSIQQVFGGVNSSLSLPIFFNEKVEFPSMESMKISHMDNMEKIWLDDLDSKAFGKLKTLEVEYCEKLLSIFSSYNMLTRFQNLEEIIVANCRSLEVVFQVREFEFSQACSTNTFQLRKLVLDQLSKMKHVWSGLPQGGLTFERLECMNVFECENLKSLFPSSVAKSMIQLKKLKVNDCGVEEIIAQEEGVGMSTRDLFFPQLTSIVLYDLPKLRSFYQNSHTSTWPLFKQLHMRHCDKMRSFSFACEFQSCQGTTISENQPALFSFEKVIPHLKELELTREDVEDVAMLPRHYVFRNLTVLYLGCYHHGNVAFPSDFLLQGFPNLEGLAVQCSSFEEIFPEDALGHGGATPCGGLTDVEKPLKSLGNLKQLGLKELRNLRGVWKHGSLMAEILKQLIFLFLWQCPSLSIVFPSWASLQRLTKLEVRECAGLVHMGTRSAMTSLVHLIFLTLRDCGAMEDVVTDDGDGAEEIPFPELKELILDRLPSLESFSQMNCAFRFPSLKHIVITQCPKMNTFCKGALRTPKVDKVLLSEEDGEGRWEGDLNTTVQTLLTCNDPHRIQ